MSNNTFEFERDDIKFYVHKHVAVLKFKKDMFNLLADPTRSAEVLSLLDWVEKDDVVHALLVLNEPGVYGEEAFKTYITSLLTKSERGIMEITDPIKKLTRARQMNMFRNFILKVVKYDKLFIMALQGDVVTPFFGITLAAEFRFAHPDMRFVLAHSELGVHPSAALPFFLQRYIGQSRASDILYCGCDIEAIKALEMGLINEVFDSDFEKAALEKALKLSDMDSNVLRLTKKLNNIYIENLEKYFDEESKLIGF
jgi:enoyl-CoA hydratase/carnithine racemase